MKVWASRAVPVLFKLEGSGGNAEVTANHSGSGEWEELTFDFTGMTAALGTVFDIVLIFDNGVIGDYTNNPSDWIFYFDDIALGEGGGIIDPVPTEAAPVPTEAAADVVSLFSNVYPDVPVSDWSTTWDEADVADILVAGDDVKEYTFTIEPGGFAGINFEGPNALDGTGFTHLRLDVWTPDVTNLQVKLVDFGGDGYTGPGSNDSEGIVDRVLAQGGWQTLEIPISEFEANGLNNVTELSQIILESTVAGVKLYLDNLYFVAP